MATLVISHPKHGRVEFPLITDTITIGRMNDNTIQIRDDSVSGQHARITHQEGRFHLEDLGSANRCFLEGKEVSEVDLTRDCTLRFGNVNCEFQLHGIVSDSIAEQFSHFQKQIESLLADRDEALRKRRDAMAERNHMKEELEALLAKPQDSGKHGSGMLQKLAAPQNRAEELACDARNLPEPGDRDQNLVGLSEQSEDLTGKGFDAICNELRAANADAAALRVEGMELKRRAEFLAQQIESLTAQRDELQRSNLRLNAQLAEIKRRMDWLTRRHEKVALELEESRAELQQLISGAEIALSRFERLAKNLSGSTTATFPSSASVPSTPTTHSGSIESGTASKCASFQPPEKFVPPSESFGKELAGQSIELTSISGTPSKPPARAFPPGQTGATEENSNTGGAKTPQIDPSPAISPAVLAGRGFTPGVRDTIHPLVADIRRLFASFSENWGDLTPLDEILRDAYNLTQRTASIDSHALFNLASALEALIRDVHRTPDRITDSALNTIAEALDLLELMLDERYFRQAAQLPDGRTCVIENNIEIRNAVLAAMKTVNLEPKWSTDTSQTRSIVKSRPLDLILIDRTCHLEDSQDPISLVRGMSMHAKTPIIAIQEAGTPPMEGTEAVSKPFNQRELAVKSLTLIFKGQLGIA